MGSSPQTQTPCSWRGPKTKQPETEFEIWVFVQTDVPSIIWHINTYYIYSIYYVDMIYIYIHILQRKDEHPLFSYRVFCKHERLHQNFDPSPMYRWPCFDPRELPQSWKQLEAVGRHVSWSICKINYAITIFFLESPSISSITAMMSA